MSTTNASSILRGLARLTDSPYAHLPHHLDLSGALASPYAGATPAEELHNRLTNLGRGEDHTEALTELARQLSAQEAWDTAVAVHRSRNRDKEAGYLFAHPLRTLAEHGFFDLDDTVFTLGAGDPDLTAGAVAALLSRGEEGTAFTYPGLLAFASTTSHPGTFALVTADRFAADITEADLDQVVDLVAIDLDKNPAAAIDLAGCRLDRHPVLNPELTDYLAAGGTLVHTVVALRLGWVMRADCHGGNVLMDDPAALALLAATDRWNTQLTEAITANVADLPVPLISGRAAGQILTNVRVSDVEEENPDLIGLLVDLVEASGGFGSWLGGGYRRNRPSVAAIRLAIARGLLTADRLLDMSQHPSVSRQSWFDYAVQETPGVAPALRTALAELGEPSHRNAESFDGYAKVVAGLAEHLGEDPEMWDRFLNAGPTSPFNNPGLTLGEAAEVFRTRWEAARNRRRTR